MMVAFATINLGMVAWEDRDFQAALEYSERAVGLFRELDDLGGVASALGTCGWSSLALSDPEHAEASFREALALACGLAWKRGVAVYAAGLAATLVAGGKAEQAAQLYGAVASIHEELGILFDDAFQEQVHERDLEAALGDDAFSAARVRGEGMTPEEIVAFVDPEQSVRSPS